MKKIITLVLYFLVANYCHSESLEDYMAASDEIIGGHPIVEYANIWWQWTVLMQPEVSPVRDTTGRFCGMAQGGDVWFLAGGYGTSKIKRRCEMPAGKYIFFPVINMIYYPSGTTELTCESVKQDAALNNDALLSIEVELNGIKALNPANTRLRSKECFDLLGRVPRDQNPPKVYPAASDGYWVMLKPLEKGTHTLKFNAAYNRESGAYSKSAQDIEYELIVQ